MFVVEDAECFNAIADRLRPCSSNSSLDRNAVTTSHQPSTISVIESSSGSFTTGSELESVLSEREAELRNLRETMEQNEKAMLQVIADQRCHFNSMTSELNRDWNRKLDDQMLKATTELSKLSKDVARLKAENSQLKETVSSTNRLLQLGRRPDADIRSSDNRKHNNNNNVVVRQSSAPEMVSTSSPADVGSRQLVRCKSMSPLVGQNIYSLFSDCFAGATLGQSPPNSGDVSWRAENAPKLPGKEQPVDGRQQTDRTWPPTLNGCQKQTEMCTRCIELEHSLEKLHRKFNSERAQWLEEKSRVVSYQKLLQVSYVQLVERCDLLEKQLVSKHSETDSNCHELIGGKF